MASFSCCEKMGGPFCFARLLAHVDHADDRHFFVVARVGISSSAYLPVLHVVEAFHAGRGGAEHDDGAFHLAAHDRDIAGV